MSYPFWDKCGHATTAEGCYTCLLAENAKLKYEVGKLTDVVVDLNTEIDRLRDYPEETRIALLRLSEERERCAKVVETFDDWVWPDKKSEAFREAGDWASPNLDESMDKLAAEIRQQPEKSKSGMERMVEGEIPFCLCIGPRHECSPCLGETNRIYIEKPPEDVPKTPPMTCGFCGGSLSPGYCRACDNDE